jgi:hypothetical protein
MDSYFPDRTFWETHMIYFVRVFHLLAWVHKYSQF